MKIKDSVLKIKESQEANNTILNVQNDGKTAVVVVDMINDFYTSSAMANPLVNNILFSMKNFLKDFSSSNSENIIFICESHTKDSIELNTYPVHGVSGTEGAEIISYLSDIPFEKKILKNCTNGFHVDTFKKWLLNNQNITKVIFVGVCIDICVMQIAMSTKTFCNQINRSIEVIIPKNMVETYDSSDHDRNLFYYMSLELLKQSGCSIVNNINFIS